MSRTRPIELEPLVNQFQHLSEKRRAPEALEKLKKIASIVKPIMRQRDWIVGTLAEFYPSEANLLGLNINRGQKICLRLRYPGDETQFLPIENVVDTMLHELAHNVHGPHDQAFHALWDKLRDEHEALVSKGYTGEGFLGQGNRVGGRHIPLSELRRQARAAAEARKIRVAGSGQKLGGTGILRGQDARKIIAAAAEKRIKIERGCASNTDKGRKIAREEELKKEKVTTTTVEQENEDEAAIMQAYIDLIQEEEREQFGHDYIPPSQSNPAGMRGVSAPPSVQSGLPIPLSSASLVEQQKEIEQNVQRDRPATSTTLLASTLSRRTPTRQSSSDKSQPDAESRPETWTCDICTLVNPILYLTCDACGTERPVIFAEPPDPPQRPNNMSKSRKQPQSSNRETPNALKPRLNAADALARFEQQAAYKKQMPVGWKCSCGNWMEQEWWTCSVCGRMKTNS